MQKVINLMHAGRLGEVTFRGGVVTSPTPPPSAPIEVELFGRESREVGMCMNCVMVPCLCELVNLENRLNMMRAMMPGVEGVDWPEMEPELFEDEEEAKEDSQKMDGKANEDGPGVDGEDEPGVAKEETLVEVDSYDQTEALGEQPDWSNGSPKSKIALGKLGEGENGGVKAYHEILKESSASQDEGPQAEQGEGVAGVLGEEDKGPADTDREGDGVGRAQAEGVAGGGDVIAQVGLLEGKGTSEGTLTPPEPTPGVGLEGQGTFVALAPQEGETGGGAGHGGGGEGRQVGLLEGQGTVKGTLTPPEPTPRLNLEGQGTTPGTLTPQGTRRRGRKQGDRQ